MIRLWILMIALVCLGQTERGFAQQEQLKPVPVPNVQGMFYPEAAGVLEHTGLKAERSEQQSERRSNTVIAQSYEPKQMVPRGTTVLLTVSITKGAPTAQVPNGPGVPDLVGRSQAQATSRLSGMNLILRIRRSLPSPQPSGTVLFQDPPAGGEIPEKRIVTVDVAQAAAPAVVPPAGDAPIGPVGAQEPGQVVAVSVKVPDVHGQNVEAARHELSDANLLLGRIERVHSPDAAGTIVNQDPLPGLYKGPVGSVKVRVSTGIVPPGLTVPDLTGWSLQAASNTLTSAGLALGTVKLQLSSTAKGTVVGQSPPPRSLAKSGQRVGLFVSKGPGLIWAGGAGVLVLLGGFGYGLLNKPPQKPIPPSGLRYVSGHGRVSVRLKTTKPDNVDRALRFFASHGRGRQTIKISDNKSRKG